MSTMNDDAEPPYKLEIGDESLNFQNFETSDPIVTVNQLFDMANAKPAIDHLAFSFTNTGDFVQLAANENVDLRRTGTERFLVFKSDRSYRFAIEGEPFSWGGRWISGKAIRRIGEIQDSRSLIQEKRDEPDRIIENHDLIDLDCPEVEKFYSRKPEWKLKIRQNIYTFNSAVIPVREALSEAGFDLRKGWDIVLITSDGRENVQIDGKLDLSRPGIERLRVKPTNVNNGEASSSFMRDFSLLPKDEDFLDEMFPLWEARLEQSRKWLILRKYALPMGFNAQVVDLALDIPDKYPASQIDMFYVYPQIALEDGRLADKTNKNILIEGKNYQRWSRHRQGETTWDPSYDCIETHMALVEECIGREVGR